MTEQTYERVTFTLPKKETVQLSFDVCVACGCIVMDKARHDAWHDKVGAASMGFGGLIGL